MEAKTKSKRKKHPEQFKLEAVRLDAHVILGHTPSACSMPQLAMQRLDSRACQRTS